MGPLGNMQNLIDLSLGLESSWSHNLPIIIKKFASRFVIARTKRDLSFLKKLNNLVRLDLSGNQITTVNFLGGLPNIEYINLSHNNIADISPLLELIKKGIRVGLDNDFYVYPRTGIILGQNPLSKPPLEIIKSGNQSILDYFGEIELQGGTTAIFEAKLLLLGEGGAGKTSLARRLINAKADMPEDSTKGIDIHQYNFKTKEKENFTIRIWDFGGQEIYHATHQFFLTKRSLYILVDDTLKDDQNVNDESFNYWLQVIELLSENSPLLIVQNEKSDRKKPLDLPSIQGRFSNAKGSWATNIKTRRGLGTVKDAIEYHVQQLPHIGEELPRLWAKIRLTLENLSKDIDYISLDKYLQICADNQIPERDRALKLSSYLHDLGTFLHFQNDLTLANLFILRNTWATDAVYMVLDNDDVKSKYGYFTEDDLIRIWQAKRYRNKQPELLALMEKFQLCFKLQDLSQHTWLAPQLLPKFTPKFEWDYSSNLQMRYKYEFMPKGLLSKFFVRMNRYVRQPERCWRSGVFLSREKTDALVQETYGTREIFIRVKGSYPKELMTLISEEFDAINKNFGDRLKVQKLIPCICSHCKNADKISFYEYDNLKRRKEKNVQSVNCDISFEDVSVIGLLDGVFTNVEKTKRDLGFQTTTKKRRVHIFLASSLELESERKAIEVWIGRENKRLLQQDIFLHLYIWEDFIDSMNPVRKQNEYNQAVLASDVFVSLFATRVGKYTEEEFNIAYGQFLKTGKPKHIYTYFKDISIDLSKINLDEISNLKRFQQRLKDLGHFPNSFSSTSHLILQLKQQLDKILPGLS